MTILFLLNLGDCCAGRELGFLLCEQLMQRSSLGCSRAPPDLNTLRQICDCALAAEGRTHAQLPAKYRWSAFGSEQSAELARMGFGASRCSFKQILLVDVTLCA